MTVPKWVDKAKSDEQPTGMKVLGRLTPNSVNSKLAVGMADAGFTLVKKIAFWSSDKIFSMPSRLQKEYSAFNLQFVRRSTNLSVYKAKESNNISIMFDTATDTSPTKSVVTTSDVVFNFVKSSSFKDIIEKAVFKGSEQPICIYVPVITVYDDFRGVPHSHIRGVCLYAELQNGRVIVPHVFLIDPKSFFFGYFCPYSEIKRDIINCFFECSFERIFTGHQSVLLGDSDSSGYRIASYGVQLTIGIKPNDLKDDVNYSTKFTQFFEGLSRKALLTFTQGPFMWQKERSEKSIAGSSSSSHDDILSGLEKTEENQSSVPPLKDSIPSDFGSRLSHDDIRENKEELTSLRTEPSEKFSLKIGGK